MAITFPPAESTRAHSSFTRARQAGGFEQEGIFVYAQRFHNNPHYTVVALKNQNNLFENVAKQVGGSGRI